MVCMGGEEGEKRRIGWELRRRGRRSLVSPRALHQSWKGSTRLPPGDLVLQSSRTVCHGAGKAYPYSADDFATTSRYADCRTVASLTADCNQATNRRPQCMQHRKARMRSTPHGARSPTWKDFGPMVRGIVRPAVSLVIWRRLVGVLAMPQSASLPFRISLQEASDDDV